PDRRGQAAGRLEVRAQHRKRRQARAAAYARSGAAVAVTSNAATVAAPRLPEWAVSWLFLAGAICFSYGVHRSAYALINFSPRGDAEINKPVEMVMIDVQKPPPPPPEPE